MNSKENVKLEKEEIQIKEDKLERKKDSILQNKDSNRTTSIIKNNNSLNLKNYKKLTKNLFTEKYSSFNSSLKFIVKTEKNCSKQKEIEKKQIIQINSKEKKEEEDKNKKESIVSYYSDKHWRKEMIEDLFEYEKCYFIKYFQVVLSFDSNLI